MTQLMNLLPQGTVEVQKENGSETAMDRLIQHKARIKPVIVIKKQLMKDKPFFRHGETVALQISLIKSWGREEVAENTCSRQLGVHKKPGINE